MTTKKKWTEEEIFVMLKNTYPAGAYSVLQHVPTTTGIPEGKERYSDCLIFSHWPSRGVYITGVEIKCSKADLLRELNDPTKSEAFARYCKFWYIAAPKGIVDVNELPDNWGLMETARSKMKVVKKAKENESVEPPPTGFTSAIMRRFYEQEVCQSSRSYMNGYQKGVRDTEERLKKDDRDYELEIARREVKEYEDAFVEFEKKSGVKIRTWTAGEIGTAVKTSLMMKNNIHPAVKGVIKRMETVTDNLKLCLLEVNATMKPKKEENDEDENALSF